jgi:photosystem II stability/assembly factor-like uncharacterized protein
VLAAIHMQDPSPALGQLSVRVSDISPNGDPARTNGDTGGRVNGLGAASNGNTYYAATEWGGLYKSQDRGRTWFPLEGHLPTATWDVAVDPTNADHVYATSFYDGRVNSLAGINVSNDGGATWIRPPTAVAPPSPYTNETRRTQPSAFGIAIDPENPQNVYIGTNTGLAISRDSGATWQFVDPTPGDSADNVWDVVVHDGGIIDLVGDDGHRRSTDGGMTWTTATSSPLPSGVGSIAVSPDEPYVLFAVVGVTIFESDDGGASWPNVLVNPRPQGRVPYVVTNQRSGPGFNLWFGDVGLYWTTCQSGNRPGGAPRCPANNWTPSFSHSDVGDLALDPTVGTDACPVLCSNDGGIYYNAATSAPACHTPQWTQPDLTPRALWAWAGAGAHQIGDLQEDLYIATQDNGSFAARDAGAEFLSWKGIDGGDAFEVTANSSWVLSTAGLFNPPNPWRLFLRGPGMTGGGQVNTYPPGQVLTFLYEDNIVSFGQTAFAITTDAGIYSTNDVTANPIVWTALGPSPCAVFPMNLKVAIANSTPVFHMQCKNPNLLVNEEHSLWRYVGLGPGGAWQPIQPPAGMRGFGIYDVDRNNPWRIIACAGSGNTLQMVLSQDGGASWTRLLNLDALMTGGGLFRYVSLLGPMGGPGIGRYVQPTLVAFDPENANLVIAGAADAGVFLSTNGGFDWVVLTDPLGVDPNLMHLPRPRAAYFDHEPAGTVNISVATQGRGMARIRLNSGLYATEGRVRLLRVHDVGTGYGPPYDSLDAEVIVWLDTQPGQAYGFTLREDTTELAHRGMLDRLRDSFNRNTRVRLDYIKYAGQNNSRLLRVTSLP